MRNRLCPYLINCETEDISNHNCSGFKECEIYQINEIFQNAYGNLGIRKTYAPVKRFTLKDLENDIDNNGEGGLKL